MKKSTANLIFIILIIFAGVAIAILTSCKTTWQVSKEKKDSVSIVKVDSGTVKVVEASKEDAATWFRDTYTMQPINNDTTINHYYTTVIKEGGTISNKSNYKSNDSSWRNSYDSMKVVLQNIDKKSKTQILSFWQILGIAAGCSIFFFIISQLKFK